MSFNSGFSGILLNFFPWMNAWLCHHKEDSSDKRDKVQQFVSLADRVIAHKVWLQPHGQNLCTKIAKEGSRM